MWLKILFEVDLHRCDSLTLGKVILNSLEIGVAPSCKMTESTSGKIKGQNIFSFL